MTSILTAEMGDIEKIAEIIAECKRMKIPVTPPDINQSFKDFTLVRNENGETIRFGLGSIKNFGEGVADAIIKDREEKGPFTSLANFLERIKDRNLNKKSLEALIYAGALDNLGERGSMLRNIEDLLHYNKEHAKQDANQDSLFGSIGTGESHLYLKDADPMPKDEKLKWEKELLGL
jgi:DNA polymerase-3 subunit alpha